MHDADDPLSHRRPRPFDQPSNRSGTSGRSGRSRLCGWSGMSASGGAVSLGGSSTAATDVCVKLEAASQTDLKGGLGVEAGTLLFGEEQIPHINFRLHCHRLACAESMPICASSRYPGCVERGRPSASHGDSTWPRLGFRLTPLR
jgi:hypothetical protein